MAVLHQATLEPGKLTLLTPWLPGKRWSRIPAGAALEYVTSCRFDDPAGAVGIEAMLVRAGDGPIHHIPLTYRDAPLEGGEAWLIGTAEHSVLGRRWIYDACGDPTYAAVLTTTILTGGRQADEFLDVDGRLEPREPRMTASGSGTGTAVPTVTVIRRVVDDDPTRVETDSVELAIVRALDGTQEQTGARLTGAWPGGGAAAVLAHLLT
jgi:Maltokinase N-terminal cap domain